jgi:hypothetical protein
MTNRTTKIARVDRDDEWIGGRGREFQAFHGRKHGNRRGDDPIAVKQRGSGNAKHHDDRQSSATCGLVRLYQ